MCPDLDKWPPRDDDGPPRIGLSEDGTGVRLPNILPKSELPQAQELQNKIQHSGSENENAAASRHFQDFPRHRDLTTDH